MASSVSVRTSSGVADGFRCLTCQSTALRSTGPRKASISSPLRTASRAVLVMPVTVPIGLVHRYRWRTAKGL
jgi:hypothetical protein